LKLEETGVAEMRRLHFSSSSRMQRGRNKMPNGSRNPATMPTKITIKRLLNRRHARETVMVRWLRLKLVGGWFMVRIEERPRRQPEEPATGGMWRNSAGEKRRLSQGVEVQLQEGRAYHGRLFGGEQRPRGMN